MYVKEKVLVIEYNRRKKLRFRQRGYSSFYWNGLRVKAVEWWFKNEMTYPPHVMEEQIGICFERNL